MRTLIVDNYDSYTFNLYQLIAEINQYYPLVIRNDDLTWEQIEELDFDNVVISPGPGNPQRLSDFGVGGEILKNLRKPLLGVCLGHQGLGYFYGAKVIHAPEVRHGRSSSIYHNSAILFKGIPNPFQAIRYHSLLVDQENLPTCLEKIAWTQEGLIMGLAHRELPFWGVQFHPESIASEFGKTLLENFKDLTLKFSGQTVVLDNLKIPSIKKTILNSSQFELHWRKLDIFPKAEEIFCNLYAQSVNSFWLDSSLPYSDLARFSYMGDDLGPNSLLVRYHCQSQTLTITESDTITQKKESIFDYIKREIALRACDSPDLPFDFRTGFVGYLGYEIKSELNQSSSCVSTMPDAIFLLSDRLIVLDHQEHCIYLLQLLKKEQRENQEIWFNCIQQKLENLNPTPHIEPQGVDLEIKFSLSRPQQKYIEDIQHCLEKIQEGETYQVCLSNQLKCNLIPNPLSLYRNLRQINPAPYSAFLRFEEIAVACSSPECFLNIDPQGWVETKPIKGTIKRGESAQEDQLLKHQLNDSEKDQAENLMIVDLLRNDLGKVCQVGTIDVPILRDIETYATVHQMVSTVRGLLRNELDSLDCLRTVFPGGSMTGAPKLRTMEIINYLEQEARGIYSGTIGFLGLNGSAQFNIVIRSAIFSPQGTSIGVGGGIVALSNPQEEYQETLLKAQALIEAMVLTIKGRVEKSDFVIL